MVVSLSRGERAGVRGKSGPGAPMRGYIPGNVELRQPSGRAGDFPENL